ncbi:hypothetical protein AGMMS49525_09330 [Bacteroidia bacterium]|nr:hypothetical protein AGMMS49525_09330 [Bacteroidia bacterium]
MNCQKCNFENKDNAQFCGNCGAKLNNAQQNIEYILENICATCWLMLTIPTLFTGLMIFMSIIVDNSGESGILGERIGQITLLILISLIIISFNSLKSIKRKLKDNNCFPIYEEIYKSLLKSIRLYCFFVFIIPLFVGIYFNVSVFRELKSIKSSL